MQGCGKARARVQKIPQLTEQGYKNFRTGVGLGYKNSTPTPIHNHSHRRGLHKNLQPSQATEKNQHLTLLRPFQV